MTFCTVLGSKELPSGSRIRVVTVPLCQMSSRDRWTLHQVQWLLNHLWCFLGHGFTNPKCKLIVMSRFYRNSSHLISVYKRQKVCWFEELPFFICLSWSFGWNEPSCEFKRNGMWLLWLFCPSLPPVLYSLLKAAMLLEEDVGSEISTCSHTV